MSPLRRGFLLRNEPAPLPSVLAPFQRGVGWGPPTCLSHLLRDGVQLKIVWGCGHVATPDTKELREAMWRCCGGEELRDLPRVLLCSKCGSRPAYIGPMER